MPEELATADSSGALRDLGTGEVFASRSVGAVELTATHLQNIPECDRRDVLVFDWWVRNGDRTLSELGGNPNLLWNPVGEGKLVVIDHNLAFDTTVTAADYKFHVFSDDIPSLFSDFIARDSYVSRIIDTLSVWNEACDNLPSSWFYVDLEQTIELDFQLGDVKSLLERATANDFWKQD